MFFGPSVYVLRASLRDVKPDVWRRLAVRSETSLPKFAQILERVMGWEGNHLHMFDVGGVRFGDPEEDADYVINERSATVRHVLPRVRSALRWDYDLGDSWQHDVVVEAIDEPKETTRYLICVDGARACPPEDCGGTTGYKDLVRILANPRYREHARMVEWAPGGFDPAAFDLTAANRRLRAR